MGILYMKEQLLPSPSHDTSTEPPCNSTMDLVMYKPGEKEGDVDEYVG
jgi:hypothetical protein